AGERQGGAHSAEGLRSHARTLPAQAFGIGETRMGHRTDPPTTRSGTPIEPLYEPSGGAPPSIGRPGDYPFTRGIHRDMYLGKLWTMRQYAGFGSPEETNRRFRFLLDSGQTGLSVALDLPTQLGYDSDAPEAVGEVGRVGVAIDSLADMETIFSN